MGHTYRKSITERGFTLIEMLVVLVIIAILGSFALLATGDFGRARKASLEAENIQSLFQLAQTRAILQGVTLGIQIKKNEFSFKKFEASQNHWQALDDDKLLKQRVYSDGLTFTVKEPIFSSEDNDSPTLILNASGELSPFIMDILYKGQTIKTLKNINDKFILEPEKSRD